MKNIVVLMSSYNGQKYIKEQIESVINQEGVNVRLIIRDDGSIDDTPLVIKQYLKTNSNITALLESNCGAEESFNKLCKYALINDHADYYAFCDQDDVWDPDKLKIAIDALEVFTQNTPNLYFSNLKMVDENLTFIRDFYKNGEVFTNRDKTLVQIFTYGCTCVFNKKALEYYCTIDTNKTFHDNWIYVICSYLGNVIYDKIGHIQYRQHCDNLSGHKKNGISLIKDRILRLYKGNLGHDFETMAQQLLLFKNQLKQVDLKIIERVATYRYNFPARLFLLFSPKFATGHILKDACIKYRILINRL